MQNVKSGSLVRMALAFAAVLTIAGSGLALAGGPDPSYVPASSVLKGPASVALGGTADYTLEVTFTNGAVLDFPPTTGASFSAVSGFITSDGVYTAPGSGKKDRINGSFTENGKTVTSSLIVTL